MLEHDNREEGGRLRLSSAVIRRVREGDWPSIHLNAILDLLEARAMDSQTSIPFSHGGGQARFARTGQQLSISVEPAPLTDNQDLYVVAGNLTMALEQQNGCDASLDLSALSASVAGTGGRSHLHLLLVPRISLV